MIVVSNTTPLVGLAAIRRFDLLEKLFGEIYIPRAVYHEAVIAGREAGGAKREVSRANWIKTVSIKDRLAAQVLLDEMDLGEAETIVLASEMKADWVLMDEKKGRRKLGKMGLRKIGTVGGSAHCEASRPLGERPPRASESETTRVQPKPDRDGCRLTICR